MNLQTAFSQVLSELDKRTAELDAREQAIAAKETELDSLIKANKELGEVAKRDQEAVSHIKDIDQAIKDAETKKADALEAVKQSTKKQRELAIWENRLVEIEARQKAEKEQLTLAQVALSAEKETYKETLKTEFLAEVTKRLPN